MPKSRWVLFVIGFLAAAVLFVALAQVRQANGRRGVIRYIPAAADVDAVEIKLPEERNPPQPATAPVPAAAVPAPTATAAPASECPPPPPCDPVPCEITLPLEPEAVEPPPPPPPPPREWPLLGPQIPDALLHALAAENQSSLGYRPNDLVIGRVIDNRTNFQRGLFSTARAEIFPLTDMVEAPRPAVADRIKNFLIENTQGKLDKWWFPSAEKTLSEEMNAINEFSAGLASGAIRIQASDQNLIVILRGNAELLAAAQVIEFTPDKIGFFESDDRFYYAQGSAAAALATLDAASLSFKTALEESGAGKDLNEAREWLRKAAQMSPIMVMNNETTGSHLLMMAYYLGQAEDALRAAADKLPGPNPIEK